MWILSSLASFKAMLSSGKITPKTLINLLRGTDTTLFRTNLKIRISHLNSAVLNKYVNQYNRELETRMRTEHIFEKKWNYIRIKSNVSQYFTIVQIIFHFLWDHRAYCGIFENGGLLMYTLEGVSSVANFITAKEESQYNRDSNFLICSVFFVSKGNIFDVYLNKRNWFKPSKNVYTARSRAVSLLWFVFVS